MILLCVQSLRFAIWSRCFKPIVFEKIQMLRAILQGKAGRVTLSGEEVKFRWRELFQRSEDMLSAVFFSRLRYLSLETTHKVAALLIGNEAANELGDMKGLRLWPRLEGRNQRSWVEPDVLINFDNAVILVEVKPPFGGDQRFEQWRDQIQAIVHEMQETGEIPKYFHFVALGRNTFKVTSELCADFAVTDVIAPALHQVEWDVIAQALPILQQQATGPDRAVLDDWVEAFVLFGLPIQAPYLWDELFVWLNKTSTLSIKKMQWLAWTIPQPLAQALLKNTPAQPKSDAMDWCALQRFSTENTLSEPQ